MGLIALYNWMFAGQDLNHCLDLYRQVTKNEDKLELAWTIIQHGANNANNANLAKD